MTNAKLLSEPTNYAVVQLPGRAFPGVVFQGDSLQGLIAELEEVIVQETPDEKASALKALAGRLRDVRSHYEAVLGREGLELPYWRAGDGN
jgi:predicted RNase H-like HicB family nuclease